MKRSEGRPDTCISWTAKLFCLPVVAGRGCYGGRSNEQDQSLQHPYLVFDDVLSTENGYNMLRGMRCGIASKTKQLACNDRSMSARLCRFVGILAEEESRARSETCWLEYDSCTQAELPALSLPTFWGWTFCTPQLENRSSSTVCMAADLPCCHLP